MVLMLSTKAKFQLDWGGLVGNSQELTKVAELVLFDMDGVLVDTREIIERAWLEGARSFGHHISSSEFQQHIHGVPGTSTLETLFGNLRLSDRAKLKELVDTFEETAPCELMPGAREVLSQLHRANVPIGLVTSSWPARVNYVLEVHGLLDAFSIIVTRDDVRMGKPAPDPYWRARQMHVQMGGVSQPVVAIEDSITGVQAAVGAGCHCIGLDSECVPGDAKKFFGAGAYAVIESLNQLEIKSVQRDSPRSSDSKVENGERSFSCELVIGK